jgi:hypothetical protein
LTEAQEGAAIIAQTRRAALAIFGGLLLIVIAMPLFKASIEAAAPTPTMLYAQDLPLLPLFGLALLAFGTGRSVRLPYALSTPRGMMIAVLLLFSLCLWGHWGVFQGVDLSRDEQMATFDAAIYASGRLAAPIPPAWQHLAPALNLLFILPLGDHAEWVSAYLPVNALLRALVGLVTDPAATSPLLVVVGLVALWRIARRLWPDSPGSQLTALLCYLCSSQIIVTGMTTFAMSAHLAFNLVWLWLFLRGSRWGVAAALIVGFLATGAHQPLFHPLFALPFVLDLARQRRWCPFIAYGIAYVAIAAFWLGWPVWLSGHAGPVPVANDREGVGYGARLLHALARTGVDGIWTMSANLIRFISWQHLLLVPLILLGAADRRRWPLIVPLGVGIVLPIMVMALILPWQGHGWGYRYLHPVLGNACLLAGYGWRRAEAAGLDLSRVVRWTSIASVPLLSVHAVMAHRLVAAQAVPDLAIARIAADIVVIDDAPFSGNLVHNAPGLTNRPIRLGGVELRPADMARVCAGQTIAFIDAPALDSLWLYFMGTRAAAPTAHQQALYRAARAAGCRVVG